MTQVQSSKRRRGETSPTEKRLLAAAKENETTEDYRQRVRILERAVRQNQMQIQMLVSTIERKGWTVKL